MHSNLSIDISIDDERWNQSLQKIEKRSHNVFESVMDHVASDILPEGCENISLSCLLTNDANIKILNKQYRDKNKATNVLSFPLWDNFSNLSDHDKVMLELGDIVMAFETVEHESSEKNVDFYDHYAHLLVHGILHVLGLDHQDDESANHMESIEISILQSFGVKNPYEST